MNNGDLNNNFKKMDISTPPKQMDISTPPKQMDSDSSSQGHTSDNISRSLNNSITSESSTIVDSPSNYNNEDNNEDNNNLINDLYKQIYSLNNEINILKNKIKAYEFNYKDVPIPATEVIDKHGNYIFTLCPLTTAHRKDALLFTEDGKLIKAKKQLFIDLNEEYSKSKSKSKSPPSKKRRHKDSKGGKKSRKNRV